MINREPVLDYILLNANVRSVLAQQDVEVLGQAIAQMVDNPAFAARPEELLYNTLLERTGLDAAALQSVLAATEDLSQVLASTMSPQEMQQLRAAVDLSLQDADFYRRLHQDLETASRDQLGLSEGAILQFGALASGRPPRGPNHIILPPWWDVFDYYLEVNRDLRLQMTAEELVLLNNLVERALQDVVLLNSLSENPATVLLENGIDQDLQDRINAVVEEQRRRRFSEHLAHIDYGSFDIK